MNRQDRIQIAQETVKIIKAGGYTSAKGSRVDISSAVQLSAETTRLVRPDEWAPLIAAVRSRDAGAGMGRIEVTAETTLAALKRMIVSEQYFSVGALNFASAKNPGGGFLHGSQAQEESLARASGLYATLIGQTQYYHANRTHGSLLYTDHAILSPSVPIFRDDDGVLLERSHCATFITMPAANIGAMTSGSADIERVATVMERRMNCVFALVASTGTRHLVLGTWGCGAFGNDPDLIARLFAKCLTGPNSWRPFFDRILFAVFDVAPDARNRLPFERHLAVLNN